MKQPEAWLRATLLLQAAILACALPAALLPTEWMDAIHQGMGMGQLPRAPLVEYLTRSISLIYAAWAPLLVAFSLDLRRHLPLVRVFGWLTFLGGPAFFALDIAVGMPMAWAVTEGGAIFLFGVAMLGLEAAVRAQPQVSSPGS
jgi:hypothetical protein